MAQPLTLRFCNPPVFWRFRIQRNHRASRHIAVELAPAAPIANFRGQVCLVDEVQKMSRGIVSGNISDVIRHALADLNRETVMAPAEVEHEHIITLRPQPPKTRTRAGETMSAEYRRHHRFERLFHPVAAPWSVHAFPRRSVAARPRTSLVLGMVESRSCTLSWPRPYGLTK